MINPLPKHAASLSKYIRVEKYYELLASITEDTPERQVRSAFDQNLYVTAKARYLIVKGGIVVRDKLIDLVYAEGGFTERLKMVMYFLFMFRDPRYREFICRVVADKNGKWNAAVFSDTHSEFFKGVGGRKAFTNLRQFLGQTGILQEGSWSVQVPEIEQWFPDAVQIAVNSINAARLGTSNW